MPKCNNTFSHVLKLNLQQFALWFCDSHLCECAANIEEDYQFLLQADDLYEQLMMQGNVPGDSFAVIAMSAMWLKKMLSRPDLPSGRGPFRWSAR